MDTLIVILESFLLGTAYLITTHRDVPDVIKAYSGQSFILAATGVLIAIAVMGDASRLAEFVIPILLIAVLPLFPGFFIEQILVRATVSEPGSKEKHAFWKLISVSEEQKRLARIIWLEQRHAVSGRAGITVFFLVVLAFAIVFLTDLLHESEAKIGVAVSLALHLIGLYNTFLRRDILSQVIGILTMDQGMYLAILKVVNIPAPAVLFVVALYFYTIITVIILFLILPRLRQEMKTLSLDDIAQDSTLEG